VIQHAYNNAEYPPVLETAREEVRKDSKNVLLLQKFRKPVYDPFPALLNTLVGHESRITSVALTPDGKRALSGSWDNTLRLWDLESGACLSLFKTNSAVQSLEYSSHLNSVISGVSTGRVLFLQPFNFIPDIPKITSQSLWHFDDSNEKDRWDKNITSLCLSCGTRFKVPENYISLIKDINKEAGITPEMSPCLSLPDEAFENPGLLSECPNCRKPLRFNPFIVDNKNIS